MMVSLKHPLALTAALLATAAVPLAANAGEVSLTGEGVVRYNPDSARLQFSVSAEHRQAQKASAQVADTMDKWRSAIKNWRDQLQDYSDADVNLYTRTLPVQEKGKEPERVSVASQTVSFSRSEEHTSELQSRPHLVCRLLLEKKNKKKTQTAHK